MTALTAEELLAWVDTTSTRWQQLLAQHPHALQIPCDVRETTSIAGLLQHIVAVELRFAQRLAALPETSYDQIPTTSIPDIFAIHTQADRLFRQVLANPGNSWEESVEFTTRSIGTLRATRRTLLVHALMHSIRHYAQLATLVRQHGITPGWQMDYLLMGAQRV